MSIRPGRQAALARAFARDLVDLLMSGGCPTCERTADLMCAACGGCGCTDHDTCTREDTTR